MAKQPEYQSLLENWSPPLSTNKVSEEGVVPIPIAFLSTTFTFDAEFFEEECLTRFLVMETEKENDGAAYLIEREEKLAGLKAGIILADQQHCNGSRSLRWDLVPCRVKNGVMHAKITILHWSNCIRVIVGSANLTKAGYCINQEVFCSIDYYPGSSSDLNLISEILRYLKEVTDDLCGSVIKERYRQMQQSISVTLRKWGIARQEYAKDDISIQTLFVSPKQRQGLVRLRAIWDSNFNSPPEKAFIVSPFFDPEESDTAPSKSIIDILQQRGSITVNYAITTDKLSEGDSQLIANAPAYLNKAYKDNQEIEFEEVLQEGANENEKIVPRPLHLKTIWLSKGDDLHLLQIGSSNFTSPALGLGRRCNYEANLVFCVNKTRNKIGFQSLHACWPQSHSLDVSGLMFRHRENIDEPSDENAYLDLPDFFGEVVVKKSETDYVFHIFFNTSVNVTPKGFRVLAEKSEEGKPTYKQIYSEADWLMAKAQDVEVFWNEPNLPDSLLVEWEGSEGRAFWPVIAAGHEVLPVVDSLKGLPLEALLMILNSSQPLHRLLSSIEKIKEKVYSKIGDEQIIDPHQLVDTSRFLLQRTRRISQAMSALRNRLEKVVFTSESLNWRLYGPIGVKSLQEAITNEAKSAEEQRFLLAELALELSRVSPKETDISIKGAVVKAEIKKVIEELVPLITDNSRNVQDQLDKYSQNALSKALHELSV